MLCGFLSINDMWPTRDSLDEVRCVTEIMPKDAFKDLYQCLHFSDNRGGGDDVNWDEVYPDKKFKSSDATS